MATFKLRRFKNPDALKAIAPHRLIQFFSSYSSYLHRRGLNLTTADDIDYVRLVEVLMVPDEDVPQEMVEALYFVHEMAEPNAMESILAAARERKIQLDLDAEPTAADVAVAMWLANPELLRDLEAECSVGRTRSFEFFSGAEGRRRDFPKFDDQLRRNIADRLDAWFVEHRRGDGSSVLVYPHRTDKLILLIRHGATMWRQGTIQRGKSGIAYFRPEVHDALVYDASNDVLGLRTAMTKGESNLYRRTFGEFLFGSSAYFSQRFELTLEPLKELGPEILACDDVPEIKGVTLVEVKRNFGGETKHRATDHSTDLFKTFGTDWAKRLRVGRLVSATFEVTLGEGRATRKRKVAINPANVTKYERDDDDTEIIETWLKQRGLMPLPEEETENAPTIETPLPSPGGSPESDHRPTGVETTS